MVKIHRQKLETGKKIDKSISNNEERDHRKNISENGHEC